MFERPPPSAGEVRALAHQLMQWADHLSVRPDRVETVSEEERHELLLALAGAMRGVSRLRARIFADAPLGNANWDTLLDLFIRELNGYRTSFEQMSVGDEVPAFTTHRALEELAAAGLVARTADLSDPRVSWLALTERGKQRMFELLAESAELVHLHPSPARG